MPDHTLPIWTDGTTPALDQTNLRAVNAAALDGSPVSTVATLKGLTGVPNGTLRDLAGYLSAGDGGEGKVRRNTSLSSFNEGTAFDHNTEAGGWERLQESEAVKAAWFGAVGDDIINDTTALQAMLNYGVPRSAKMRLETGKIYKITSKLDIPTGNRWTLDLNNSSVKQYTTNTPGVELVGQNPAYWTIENGRIENATFQPIANTNAVAIRVQPFGSGDGIGVHNFTVRNIEFGYNFRGLSGPIDTSNPLPLWGVTVEKCHTPYELSGAMIRIVNPDGVSGQPNVNIRDCHVLRDPVNTQEPSLILHFVRSGTISGTEINNGFGKVAHFEQCLLHFDAFRIEGVALPSGVDSLIYANDCLLTMTDIEAQSIDFQRTSGRQSVIRAESIALAQESGLSIRGGYVFYPTVASGGTAYFVDSSDTPVNQPWHFSFSNLLVQSPVNRYLDQDWTVINLQFDDARNQREMIHPNRTDASLSCNPNEPPTNRWGSPLTANRTETLPTSGLWWGMHFRTTRALSATGAFNLNVSDGATTLKTLDGPGQWVDCEYSWDGWVVVAEGTLTPSGGLVVSSQTLSNGSTISLTAGANAYPVDSAAAVTGVILAAGQYNGQRITVVNRNSVSGRTVTFAADTTSRVADGASSVIPILRAFQFVWDANFGGTGTGRWVRTSA